MKEHFVMTHMGRRPLHYCMHGHGGGGTPRSTVGADRRDEGAEAMRAV